MNEHTELSDAIFALGVLGAEGAPCNRTLLCRSAAIAAEAIPASGVGLAVFGGERLDEAPPIAACAARRVDDVRSNAGDTDDLEDTFVQQAGHYAARIFEEPAWAGRSEHKVTEVLEGFSQGELHQWAGDEQLWSEVIAGGGSGTTFVGVFPHATLGVRLLLVIAGAADDASIERARALCPYLVDCWNSGWSHEPEWMHNLKPASRLVLELVLQGLDDEQIAQRSELTYHSVRAHLKRLFKAAGVRSRLHLMQECRACNVRVASVAQLAHAV